ncbi:MAG: metal transporter [Lysobacterales bacterium]|nr:MAG: metal transporter [Xanthomonadales bacterium]
MIQTLLYDTESQTLRQGGAELIDAWLAEPQTLLWSNFFEESPVVENELFHKRFGLHPLAIQDAQRDRHPPKIERFDDHIFLLVRGLTGEVPGLESGIVQIALFIGERFLVSRHSRPSPSIRQIYESVASDPSMLAMGPANVAGTVARRISDRYWKILMDVESRLEALEEEIFEESDDRHLEELIGYRTSLEKYRRVFNYHVHAFDDLRKNFPVFFPRGLIHLYVDVYEQFDREKSLADMHYGLAADLMDGYISVSSHRLNNIVKILTIVTTIFVPLGFLAGIYGMNFEYMPELQSKAGYFILLSVMGAIAATALLVFKRIRWL